MDARARRFRVLFWVVVALGALPSLVSGIELSRRFRMETLCASERPTIDVDELRAMARWERLHDWGRVGAMVSGLLVVAYSVAWAFEAGVRRPVRQMVVALAAGLLLPALGVATWTGRSIPWRALEPAVSLGAAGGTLVRAPEEVGGPAYCAEHPRQLRNLELAYLAHLGGGAAAVALSLGLCDLGARWRAARDRRD
jgi:hypothetical protein